MVSNHGTNQENALEIRNQGSLRAKILSFGLLSNDFLFQLRNDSSLFIR